MKRPLSILLLLATPLMAANWGPYGEPLYDINGNFIVKNNTAGTNFVRAAQNNGATGAVYVAGTGQPTYNPTNSTFSFPTNGFGGSAGSGDFLANGSVPMSGVLNFGGQTATNLATPTTADSAVTKGYVDGLTNYVFNTATNYFTVGDFTLDSKVRNLELPAWIPANAVALNLNIQISSTTAGNYFGFLSYSNSITAQRIVVGGRIITSGQYVHYNGVIGVTTPSRLFYYSDLTGSPGVNVTVIGWWLR